MKVFSKELYLKDKLTGIDFIDKAIKETLWINKMHLMPVKIVETGSYFQHKKRKEIKFDINDTRYDMFLNKNWIMEV